MSYIFISYSRKDQGYAHKLAEALQNKGFTVWIDDRIDYGDRWPDEIEEHVDGCSALIVIMTPRSKESDWVKSELTRAKRKGKPIFPLLLEGEEPWLAVEVIQYVDVTTGQLPPDKFYKQLEDVVPPKLRNDKPTTRQLPHGSTPPQSKSELGPPDHKYRRIDAAAPSSTEVGNEIDLLVQVRFPNSPLLGSKDWPAGEKPSSIKQASDQVALNFPIDPQTGQQKSIYLEIQVIAPNFIIHGEERQRIEVPPDQESKVVSFLLTARKSGKCKININLYDVNVNRDYLETIHLETAVDEMGVQTAVDKMGIPPTVATLIIIVAVAEQSYETKKHFQVSQPKPVELESEKTKTEEEPRTLQEFWQAVLPRPTPQTPWQKWKDEQARTPVVEWPKPEPALKLPQTQTTRQPFEPELILIPAGEFLMGSNPENDKQADSEEQPQHRLYLPDYYMAKTPVTNAQYIAFVQAASYQTQAEQDGIGWVWKDSMWQEIKGANWQHPTGPGSDIRHKGEHPVVQVSWDDAVAYCDWLAQLSGKAYRLPSEAEWEKGARGLDGRIYPWGNEWDAQRCNTRESGKKDTTPVEAYLAGASPYGLLDMAGNVWELCSTQWAKKAYPFQVQDEWTKSYLGRDTDRVVRGGSFDTGWFSTRCAYRSNLGGGMSARVGFRVAMSPIK